MPESLRALFFVVAAALPAFFVARLVTRNLIDSKEFVLWRNCWLITVAVVFTCNSFLLFAAFLGALSLYAHRLAFKPIYLYLILLFVAPAINIPIGVPLIINKVSDFNPARLLALFFLFPTAIALMRQKNVSAPRAADKLVIVFVFFLCALSFRKVDLAEALRTCLAYSLDILLPYFVFSRCLSTIVDVRKAMLAFVIAALPLATIAVVEITKAWRIYNVVTEQWGVHLVAPYLFRDGYLRAAVTAIEPIALGVVFMVAGGCLLSSVRPKLTNLAVLAALGVILAGLFASVSRGPWLGFAVLALISVSISRRALSNLTLASLVVLVSVQTLMLTPIGERLYTLLPFVGSVERNTEDYRFRLIENSLIVIERNPLFGTSDFLAEPEMQAMIQGQGIIDVVNTYVAIALEFGIVGLSMFIMIFGLIVLQLLRICFDNGASELNFSAVLGTMLALLLTIGTTSSVSVIPYIFWTFAGLSVGLLRIVDLESKARMAKLAPYRMKVLGQ